MGRMHSRLALLLASSILSVALFELGLRVAGFRFDVAPESVEFGWPDPVERTDFFQPDPDLFWVPKDYPRKLERLHGQGAHIAFLGDSCTALGTYPRLTVNGLGAMRPNVPIRMEMLAVAGWSSYQGLRQLERDVLPASPKIATFYFGWNDHWVGFGVEDKEISGIRVSGVPGLASLRTAQLFFKGLIAWRSSRRGEKPNRVSAVDFRTNLRAMVRLSRQQGVIPVLITAPTSIEVGREPEYLTDRWTRDLREVVPIHLLYSDIVRQVALEEGAMLCDVARAFEALPSEERRQVYMKRDGIHPTRRGDRLIAETLVNCLEGSEEVRAVWVPLGSQS